MPRLIEQPTRITAAGNKPKQIEEFIGRVNSQHDQLSVEHDLDEALVLEEVKIGCTLAMLMCLNRSHRLAYILGEIVELDHNEAAEVLEITPAAFRKRLSRARASVTSFMTSRCGLVNPANACRCRRRVTTAVDLGRVDPENLLFASSLDCAKRFPEVLVRIRQLEETRRAASLYRSHPNPKPSESFVSWLRRVIDEKPDPQIDRGTVEQRHAADGAMRRR